MNNLTTIILNIGNLFGRILSIMPQKSTYALYLFRRGVATGKWKSQFAEFGKNSLIASNVTLLTPQNISIGDNSSIMRHCILETCQLSTNQKPQLTIGNNVSIGEFTHITCANRITIGNNVLTGRFVLITDNAHGKNADKKELEVPPLQRTIYSKAQIEIEDNVWIGDKATILAGVRIGRGAIIAANAVVTHNVAPYSVVAGVPAVEIKSYL